MKKPKVRKYRKGEREWIKLGWALIGYKYLYYRAPERCVLADHMYDHLEIAYLLGCRKYKKENTVVHKGYPDFEDVKGEGMMEIDESRPSVQMVMAHQLELSDEELNYHLDISTRHLCKQKSKEVL